MLPMVWVIGCWRSLGRIIKCGTVSVMALSTNADMYHMTGLVKLTTWAVFFFGV